MGGEIKDPRIFYEMFFKDFREYLSEYYRESVSELAISEMAVHDKPVTIFNGHSRGKVKIKNQGQTDCYLSNSGMGGYRLSPNESVEFFVNNSVQVVTISGSTAIGFIKS